MSIRLLAKTLLERYESRKTSPSVLFVLGAGASLESGLPLWNDRLLKLGIVERMHGPWGSKQAFLEEVWTALAPYIGYRDRGARLTSVVNRATTDQLCAVASRTARGRRALVELLCKHFPDREHCPHPQLAYELLAHLLKHGFADFVVTLNFDELIDSALGDELGHDGYTVFLSNHRDARPRRDVPRLFKLHGTISQQDSLRFTRDTTTILTDWTKQALDEAMPADQPLVVVSLGYSWKDDDFAHWLRNRQNAIRQLIVVTLEKTPVKSLRGLLSRNPERRVPIATISTRALVTRGRPATVDEVLWACWNQVRTQADKRLSLPSAARHLLVSHLFPSPAPKRRAWPSVFARHDCASRAEAELFLATAKANGMVTMSALARDPRVYRWLRQLNHDHGQEIGNAHFLKHNDFRDVTEVLFFKGTKEEEFVRYYRNSTGRQQSFSKSRLQNPWTHRIRVPRYVKRKLVRNSMPYHRFFEYYFEKVLESDEVEVDPGRRPRSTELLLPKAARLPTLGNLYRATHRLLDRDWSTLLLIAESGRWLNRYLDSPLAHDRRVFLIEASNYGLEGWDVRPPVRFPFTRGLYRLAMPWWEHNRHVTLGLSSDGRLLGGIYFRRPQKTPRISPVEVLESDKHGLRELLVTFVSYTARVSEMPMVWRRGASDDAGRFAGALLDVVPLASLLEGWPGCERLRHRLQRILDE